MRTLFVILLLLTPCISFGASFNKVESKFLRLLNDFDIRPQVSMNGKTKIYSTKLSILSIDNFPSTKSASITIIPVNDSASENMNSIILIMCYLKAVTGRNKASQMFNSKLSESARFQTRKTFISDGYKIIIDPPDPSLGVIAIQITKL